MRLISLKRDLLAVALAFAGTISMSPARAAPYISEIILPASGTTAVEIVGLDAAGATLLVVNASRQRLSVQHVISLPAASETVENSGLALVVGSNWSTAGPTNLPAATTLTLDDPHIPLFSDILPTALVLIHGQSVITASASLGNSSAVSGISTNTPIVDWVNFAPGTDAQSQLAVQSPSAVSLAALGIADLARPTVGTADVTALARALTDDGPMLDALFGGTENAILADAMGLEAFAFSPGLQNPRTSLIGSDSDDTLATPEPGVGLLLAMALLGTTRRRPARRA